ncbi:hypothetical protein SO694_00079180 [Aureococcus anophagefferens]|uniref:Uncharacterized protein n=1 Tax=Aureococcus anophagefferens TaxID=44056 RepID=A0ABR1FGZ0_AURAN
MLTADTQDAPSTPTANTPARRAARAPARRPGVDAAGSIAPLEPRAGAPPALPTPMLTADTQDAPSTPTATQRPRRRRPVVMDGSIAPLELLRVIDDNAVAGAWAKARAPATYVIMDDGGERQRRQPLASAATASTDIFVEGLKVDYDVRPDGMKEITSLEAANTALKAAATLEPCSGFSASAKKDHADGYELMVCGAMRSAADYRRGKAPRLPGRRLRARRTDGTYVFRSALCKGASDRPSSTRCSNCHKISSTFARRVKAAVPKREARPSKFEPHSSVI